MPGTVEEQRNVSGSRSSIMEPLSHENEDFDDANDASVAYSYPEGGSRAWIVVGGACMTLACTFGMMSTVGVLQTYWEKNQLKGYSSTTVGWIPSLFVFFNLMLGVQVGPLFDRYGPRLMMLIGSISYTLSMFLLGSCTEYYQFMLCFSILGGMSSAFISTPTMASLSHWFHRRRGTATGIAMAGSSVGGTAFPIILKFSLEKLGWGWSLRLMGFIFLSLLTIGNLCIKGRLPTASQKTTFDFKCFNDARFLWITIGAFFTEIVLFASLGLIPSYALAQGFGSQTGFYCLAIFNVGSGFGRWLSGLGSDHYGRFNTLSVVMTVTTIFIFILWYPFGRYIGVFYPFVATLGFGTGTILSLTPVCVGQICKTDDFGQWYGTCYFIASFGTLVGIPVGAQLLEVAGPSRLVACLGGFLGLAVLSFAMARWSSLDYHWKWVIKV
ncbi:hypothetical protein N7478_011911 [Penicillium angulare]|uniref:uncharacterized protein n=1 Tax=Penicillium angulare TaxID=116970 RepID=UPI0025426980|nr:uncharacterized protein N7478_011911 [Penicillium angulare]KAJ5261316.1 hypothetical protein N7478_011911 [Penicillium angulare]